MVLVLVSVIGVALYLLIGLVLLAWIDYDYHLFPFIAECPVPTLELVLLFGWPVLLSVYGWHRRGWCGDVPTGKALSGAPTRVPLHCLVRWITACLGLDYGREASGSSAPSACGSDTRTSHALASVPSAVRANHREGFRNDHPGELGPRQFPPAL
jgi:hypothetical protein